MPVPDPSSDPRSGPGSGPRLGRRPPRPAFEVQPYPALALDATGALTVVTWNLGKRAGRVTRAQVERLVREVGADVLAFQECRPAIGLPLDVGAHAVRNVGRHGVLTAARAAPHEVVPVTSRGRELGITTKVALFTTYALSDGRHLLVVNVHALNFDRDGRRFADQLRELAGRMANHDGPLVFCGDMNTWNEGRLGVVQSLAADLGLTEVPAERGVGRRGNATRLGNRILGLDTDLELDHVFHRGLHLSDCRWLPDFDASDHVPLVATYGFGRTTGDSPI